MNQTAQDVANILCIIIGTPVGISIIVGTVVIVLIADYLITIPNLDRIEVATVTKSNGGHCLLQTSYGERLLENCPYDVNDQMTVKIRKDATQCERCKFAELILK